MDIIFGSNRFRAGDLVQEILSFQFRACNFVHGKFHAQEISCMNRNLVHGNYVQEISCRDFFSKKLRAKQRNLVRSNSQSNERAVQDTSLVAKEFSTYEKRHTNLLQSMSSSEKFSKDAKVEDFKK